MKSAMTTTSAPGSGTTTPVTGGLFGAPTNNVAPAPATATATGGFSFGQAAPAGGKPGASLFGGGFGSNSGSAA